MSASTRKSSSCFWPSVTRKLSSKSLLSSINESLKKKGSIWSSSFSSRMADFPVRFRRMTNGAHGVNTLALRLVSSAGLKESPRSSWGMDEPEG